MFSVEHMRAVQKDNERYINKAIEYKWQSSRDEEWSPVKPGIMYRFVESAGGFLIKIGTRLQGLSVNLQADL